MKLVNYLEANKYFDEFTLEFEEPLDKEKALLAVHPHGVFTLGLSLNFYVNKFGDMLICASRMLL